MNNIIKKIGIILGVSMIVLLWNCAEADKEFVHDKNTISQMICRASHGASEFRGEIHEFNKDGKEVEVTDDFTQEMVEGGYGIILFEISKSLEEDVNLKNIYLIATLSWDESITPSLSGRHDITGDGIIITVKSGIGTTRQYRVRGEYK
jgi:dsDNA-specific endonuclease/ATPase MutS2